MAKIAIMGFGTVGSGVYEVLRRNAAGVSRRAGEPVEVKYILDIHDFSQRPDANLFVNDISVILADPEVKVVVETIGGTRFAYPYVKACLESGRSVCTSNKELVATYGAELLALAKSHNCAFLFEASVGGGTPIITPMHQCLSANVITQVQGIVNGTTNFMLTKMARENMGFDEALKIAQQLGYAETKDPGDDVDGRDAGRKIAILSSMVCGHHIYPQNVPTRGIRAITVEDVAAAEKLNCVIKLIAWMKCGEDKSVVAGVEPCLVPKANQLAGVDDVFNAVLVKGDMLGDVVFYGKGAGKLPTASAVVADVVDALKNGVKMHDSLFWQPAEPVDGMLTDPAPATYYVRVAGVAPAVAAAIYGEGEVVSEHYNGCAYLVSSAGEAQLAEAQRKVEAMGGSVELVLKRLPEDA
jgi:homoserine dehydrogenase